MTILSYKGHQWSIEYEDGQLVIQLLHIDDFISATCESAAQAEADLHELVDDYLATCEETGRAPDKPYKGSLNIRMQPELHRRAAMAAAAAGVSLNAWIVRACEAAMSAQSRGVRAEPKYRLAEHIGGEAYKPSDPRNHSASSKSRQLDGRADNVVDLRVGLRKRSQEINRQRAVDAMRA